jgi:hypothetical protein
VDTNKSNTFISLAPYFVPIYSLVVCLAFCAVTVFAPLDQVVMLWGWGFSPLALAYGLIGLTWAFHVCYTVQTLGAEQSDLLRNGEFFSVLLIAPLNVLLVSAFLIMVSPDLTWAQAWACLARTVEFTVVGSWESMRWLYGMASWEMGRMHEEMRQWPPQ